MHVSLCGDGSMGVSLCINSCLLGDYGRVLCCTLYKAWGGGGGGGIRGKKIAVC